MGEEDLKRFFKKKFSHFKYWFLDKEYPRSRFRKKNFFDNLIKFFSFCLVFMIIYLNIATFNKIAILGILIGSVFLLVLLYFIFKSGKKLFKNIKYLIRGLNHGTKRILAILAILLLLWVFINPTPFSESIVNSYEKIEFRTLIPFNSENTNFSISNPIFSFNSGISCLPNFYEDIKVAKAKDSYLRYSILEKADDANLEEALILVNKWSPSDKNSAIDVISSWKEPTIDLFIYKWSTKECFFDECLDYSGIETAFCEGESAKHAKEDGFGLFGF